MPERILLLPWLVSPVASSKVIAWFYFFQPPESRSLTLPICFFRDSVFGCLEIWIWGFVGFFVSEGEIHTYQRLKKAWKICSQDLKGWRWLYNSLKSLVHHSPAVSTISTYLRQHSYCHLSSTASNVVACDLELKMSLSLPKAPVLN